MKSLAYNKQYSEAWQNSLTIKCMKENPGVKKSQYCSQSSTVMAAFIIILTVYLQVHKLNHKKYHDNHKGTIKTEQP